MSTTNPTLGPQWTLIAPAGDELQAHLECDTLGSRTPTAK